MFDIEDTTPLHSENIFATPHPKAKVQSIESTVLINGANANRYESDRRTPKIACPKLKTAAVPIELMMHL